VTLIRRIGTRNVQGYALLVLEIDGRRAEVTLEQRLPTYGLVHLGDEWEDRVSAILSADPANSRFEDQEMRGATDDPEVLRLFKTFWRENNGRAFPE